MNAGDVYVETGHVSVSRVGTEQIADSIAIDIGYDADGNEVVVGVEVLSAVAVTVDGREVAP